MPDVEKHKDPEHNSEEKTLSTTERFYSVAIFVIFVLCIAGIWQLYALVVGVSLGVLLVSYHVVVQKYRQRKDDANSEDILSEIVCDLGEKEDTIDACKDGTRLAQSSRRKSSLPSVTDVEIASHFFHTLVSITEVPVGDLELDEGFGNDAYEIDVDDLAYCGGSSPPTYTDSRFILYTGPEREEVL